MTPDFRVSAGGIDLFGGGLCDRMLSLEVTDNEGNQSDSVSITVDDREAARPGG